MELVCVKFDEKMDSEGACCKHPRDYCKFRTSCFIHFIESDKKGDTDPEKDDIDSEAGVNAKS